MPQSTPPPLKCPPSYTPPPTTNIDTHQRSKWMCLLPSRQGVPCSATHGGGGSSLNPLLDPTTSLRSGLEPWREGAPAFSVYVNSLVS